MCFSSTNELFGDYHVNDSNHTISFSKPTGTKESEIDDGDRWCDIFPSVQSYFIHKNKLGLYYYNNQKNFLCTHTALLLWLKTGKQDTILGSIYLIVFMIFPKKLWAEMYVGLISENEPA